MLEGPSEIVADAGDVPAIGVGAGIILDATVIRALLVPASCG